MKLKLIAFFLVALMWILPVYADMTSDRVKNLEVKHTFSKDKLGIIHSVSIKNIGKDSYCLFYVLFEYYGADGKKYDFRTERQLDGLICPNETRTFENISSGTIASYILLDISDSKVIITSVAIEELNEKGKKYFKEHPERSDFKDTVVNKKICIGMTKEEVLLSWDRPKDIHRTVTANSTHEQWIYGKQYLYFDNEILTTWQD